MFKKIVLFFFLLFSSLILLLVVYYPKITKYVEVSLEDVVFEESKVEVDFGSVAFRPFGLVVNGAKTKSGELLLDKAYAKVSFWSLLKKQVILYLEFEGIKNSSSIFESSLYTMIKNFSEPSSKPPDRPWRVRLKEMKINGSGISDFAEQDVKLKIKNPKFSFVRDFKTGNARGILEADFYSITHPEVWIKLDSMLIDMSYLKDRTGINIKHKKLNLQGEVFDNLSIDLSYKLESMPIQTKEFDLFKLSTKGEVEGDSQSINVQGALSLFSKKLKNALGEQSTGVLKTNYALSDNVILLDLLELDDFFYGGNASYNLFDNSLSLDANVKFLKLLSDYGLEFDLNKDFIGLDSSKLNINYNKEKIIVKTAFSPDAGFRNLELEFSGGDRLNAVLQSEYSAKPIEAKISFGENYFLDSLVINDFYVSKFLSEFKLKKNKFIEDSLLNLDVSGQVYPAQDLGGKLILTNLMFNKPYFLSSDVFYNEQKLSLKQAVFQNKRQPNKGLVLNTLNYKQGKIEFQGQVKDFIYKDSESRYGLNSKFEGQLDNIDIDAIGDIKIYDSDVFYEVRSQLFEFENISGHIKFNEGDSINIVDMFSSVDEGSILVNSKIEDLTKSFKISSNIEVNNFELNYKGLSAILSSRLNLDYSPRGDSYMTSLSGDINIDSGYYDDEVSIERLVEDSIKSFITKKRRKVVDTSSIDFSKEYKDLEIDLNVQNIGDVVLDTGIFSSKVSIDLNVKKYDNLSIDGKVEVVDGVLRLQDHDYEVVKGLLEYDKQSQIDNPYLKFLVEGPVVFQDGRESLARFLVSDRLENLDMQVSSDSGDTPEAIISAVGLGNDNTGFTFLKKEGVTDYSVVDLINPFTKINIIDRIAALTGLTEVRVAPTLSPIDGQPMPSVSAKRPITDDFDLEIKSSIGSINRSSAGVGYNIGRYTSIESGWRNFSYIDIFENKESLELGIQFKTKFPGSIFAPK